MATGKRYYWIKLKDSFMTSDAVDFLMSQPDGANYVILYQILCLKTINTGGKLERHIGEIIIPYDEAKIQRDAKWFSIDTVRVALNLYKNLGLVYEDQNGTLTLSDYGNIVGSETDWAAQKKAQRQGQLPQSTVDNVHTNVLGDVHTDIRDKIIDNRDKRIDIEKKKEKKEKEETRFIPPTVEEVRAYCEERHNGIDPEAFIDFYATSKWKRGNTKITDWKACVRTWERRQKSTTKPQTGNIFAQIYEEEYG